MDCKVFLVLRYFILLGTDFLPQESRRSHGHNSCYEQARRTKVGAGEG